MMSDESSIDKVELIILKIKEICKEHDCRTVEVCTAACVVIEDSLRSLADPKACCLSLHEQMIKNLSQ